MGTTFQIGNEDFYDGTTPWSTSVDHRMLLLTSSHTPDPDADFVSDISANEVSDASYSRVAVASEAIVVDDANNQIELDCGDVTFPTLDNVSPAYSNIFVYNAADSAAVLKVTNTLTAPPTANGGDYVIQPSAEGVIKVSS
jgi:hypothetical protein